MVYACIAPHGDEIVPELVSKQAFAASSNAGMLRLAEEMKRARPQTVVIATPHNLRILGRIGVVVSEWSSGSVGAGKRKISLRAECDSGLALQILMAAEGRRIPVVGANYGTASGTLSNLPMDWGTLIPLWFFLRINGLRSRIVIVTPSREVPLRQNYRFGAVVAEAAEGTKRRIAFVASSDQAHAHEKSGPYGYSPDAAVYDRKVVEAVRRDRLADILAFDPMMVERARPDSLWQMSMLAGVLSRVKMAGKLYSYEVPTYFGMLCAGYTRVP